MEFTLTKEEVIQKVKEMGITKEDLGFYNDSFRNAYYELINHTKKLIKDCNIDPADARDVFPEDLWPDLDIEDKRYKIIRVKLQKTIYKEVDMVVRDYEDASDVWNYVDIREAESWDALDEEDYEEWEEDDSRIMRTNLTKDEAENYDTVNDIDDLD